MFGLFSKKPPETQQEPVLSSHQLLEAFCDNPSQFLKQYPQREYEWPTDPTDLPDMYFTHKAFAFGYIHRISFIPPNRIQVWHFAIGENRDERCGLGSRLAKWLGDEMKRRYDITEIVFDEYRPTSHHAQFMAKIGATYLGKLNCRTQYLWKI